MGGVGGVGSTTDGIVVCDVWSGQLVGMVEREYEWEGEMGDGRWVSSRGHQRAWFGSWKL